MKILITGITGFVGSNLVDFLSSLKKFTIYGLDIIKPEMQNVDSIFGWSELDKIPDVDIIIHLAGKAHDTSNTTERQEYININYGLTKTIYTYFEQSNAIQFYLMSSVAALTNSVNGELSENTKPNPQTPYGISKRMAEKYLLSKFPIGKKRVYIFRPCLIYGPGNKGNLNLLYNLVSKGIPWPLGAFNNKRSFLSIKNLAFVFSNFLEHNYPSGIYHLADDQSLSTKQLIKLIGKTNNRKVRILNIPIKIIKLIAKTGDFLHLPINSERLRKLTESYIVSNKKVKQTMGINKMPNSINKEIVNTLNSFNK